MLKTLILRSIADPRMTRLAAWLKDRPMIVLCYHDLRERHDPASWLRVEQSAFRDQLSALARIGQFIDPFAIAAPSPGGRSPLFVVTFDDGYINNLRLGVPVLEELGIPALHFISSRNLTTGEPFWFDRVAHSIQARLATALDLRDAGLGQFEFSATDDEQRWNGIQRVLEAIKGLGDPGEPRVDAAIAAIESQLPPGDLHHRFRPLSVPELKDLASSAMVRIGSHGHEHVLLTRLSDQALTANLSTSRSILENATGRVVEHLAYPNGTFDARVMAASRDAGYTRDYTTIPRRAEPAHREVPRFLIGGYDSVDKVIGVVNRILMFT